MDEALIREQEQQLQKTGKILQDAVTHMVAEAAAHLGQVVQLQSKAGIVLRQNAVGHAGDVHVELFAVGQPGLFVQLVFLLAAGRDLDNGGEMRRGDRVGVDVMPDVSHVLNILLYLIYTSITETLFICNRPGADIRV